MPMILSVNDIQISKLSSMCGNTWGNQATALWGKINDGN